MRDSLRQKAITICDAKIAKKGESVGLYSKSPGTEILVT